MIDWVVGVLTAFNDWWDLPAASWQVKAGLQGSIGALTVVTASVNVRLGRRKYWLVLLLGVGLLLEGWKSWYSPLVPLSHGHLILYMVGLGIVLSNSGVGVQLRIPLRTEEVQHAAVTPHETLATLSSPGLRSMERMDRPEVGELAERIAALVEGVRGKPPDDLERMEIRAMAEVWGKRSSKAKQSGVN